MMEYAIVDIETTGGHAAGSAITEIAIRIHDGARVVRTFDVLLDPGRFIPLPIQLLTGIDNDMVAGCPTFGDVAQQVYDLLAGRVFVAHSVNFDYSFLRYHLEREGFVLNVPKLCTVRLSRKVRPGLRSYSLGKLCAALDIPLYNHHRAGGDADATALLFSRLLEWDTEGHLAAMLKKNSREQLLPPNLPKSDFEQLPQCPGVYYFCDQAGKAIYVGKALNIRKRVASHFTGNNPNPQRQNFLRNIYSIRYEACGTELMALLLEATEIKKLWPQYNRAQKHQEPKFGLYAYEDLNGYMRLVVGKHARNQLALHVFYRRMDGTHLLHKLVREFDLCPELCLVGECEHCRHRQGAAQDIQVYNRKVKAALNHLEQHLPTFALLDAGRHEGEQSCIWIERGNFYGMGYIDRDSDLRQVADIKSLLTPYAGNHYMLQLVYSHAERYPHKVKRPEEPGPQLVQAYNDLEYEDLFGS